MSERRRVLIWAVASAMALSGAVAMAPVGAQDLETWRARKNEQSARTAEARRVYDGRFGRTVVFDHPLVTSAIGTVAASAGLPSGDSAAVVAGFARAERILRERHGAAAIALLATARWGIEYEDPSARDQSGLRRVDFRHRVRFARLDVKQEPGVTVSPVAVDEVERFVLMSAGVSLVAATPALRHMAGYAAFMPNEEIFAEVARRLATSWSGTARRCATGAVAACETLLRPFDGATDPTRYYDPVDFKAIVTVGRLPALGDSVFFAERRACLDGNEAVCARLMDRVDIPDPFNAASRGTLLTYAIEIGGSEAVARAAERKDASSVEAAAHIAGVSPDSLLIGWRARVFRALDETRGATTVPLFFTTLAWSGILLALAARRRYL